MIRAKIVAAASVMLVSGALSYFSLLHAGSIKHKTSAISPFEIYPFSVPEQYQKSLNNYRKWARMTGFEYSGLHWRQFAIIYTNIGQAVYKKNYNQYMRLYQNYDEDNTESADMAFYKYDTGTIFVKENYATNNGSPGQPLTLTIMIKREKGYDPDMGDWQYIQSDVSGKIIFDGASNNKRLYQACISCHANIKERDYIFSTYYSAPTGANN